MQRTNVQNEGIIRLDKRIGKVVRRTNVQNGLNTLSTIKKKLPWNQMKKRKEKKKEIRTKLSTDLDLYQKVNTMHASLPKYIDEGVSPEVPLK